MSNGEEPLSRFQPGGTASIINYNIPESTSYGGQGYIELDIHPDWFADSSRQGSTFADWVGEHYGIGSGVVHEFDEEGVLGRMGRFRRIREAVEDAEAFRRIRDQLKDEIAVDFEQGAHGPLVLSRNEPAETAALELARAMDPDQVTGSDEPYTLPMALRLMRGTGDGAATPPAGSSAGETESLILPMVQRQAVSEEPAVEPSLLRALRPGALATDILNNQIPIVYRGFTGVPSYTPAPAPVQIEPRLMLVERYRISTYLGDYGAGRTLKTFSLLPGEQTKISIKTYKHTETKKEKAQSILESKTQSAARRFEEHIGQEQWNKEEYAQSKSWTKASKWSVSGEYSNSANAGVNLGIAKIGGESSLSVSGGVSGSTERSRTSNVAREAFAKNTMNAVSESSAEASSHREVEVNTSQETSEEAGFERTIERHLENINLSRTLNFVFRQLNQEYITVFHLEDVRLAFVNGAVKPSPAGNGIDGLEYREVPLWKLDELVADVIEEDHHEEVRRLIRRELENVVGHDGETHSIVSEGEIVDTQGEVARRYLHIDKGEPDEYVDPRLDPEVNPDRKPIRVPGVILDVEHNVMRTDGVIVEALLGKGEALDGYSKGLQAADVELQRLGNDQKRAALERAALARELVEQGDAEDVDRYVRLFGSDGDQLDLDVVIGGDGEEDDEG